MQSVVYVQKCRDRNVPRQKQPDRNRPDQNGLYRNGQTEKSCSGGATSIGWLGKPHDQQQFQIFLRVHTKTGPSRVCDEVTPPGPWTTFGSLSRGFSRQDLPHQPFVGHSGYMAELTWLCSLNSEKCFDIQGSANFTAAQFVAKCHTSGVMRAAQWPVGESLGDAEKSQQCRKFFLQCSTFTPKRS